MTTPEYDPFDLSTGLLDDYDFTITEAFFTTDSRFGESVILKLVGTTDSPDKPEDTQLLTGGTGWEIVNGGASIQSENGKPRNFNKNSTIGLWIARLTPEAKKAIVANGGSPMVAKAWEGLTFHMKNEEITGFDGTKKDKLLPNGFVGNGGGAKAAGATPTTDNVEGVDDLKALAAATADYAEFVEKAFADDGLVTKFPSLATLASSEKFHTEHAAA